MHGIAPSTLDPRAAWRSTVDCAIQRGVDAVLLAGDVVDSKNHFMEASGALLEGVERLGRRNIDVVCVAGNHDVATLPRMARELENMHLLGEQGTWSSYVVRRGGEPLVRVIGWSFPKVHVESNPLDSMPAAMLAGRYEDQASDDLRTVGLLHCDLDGGGDQRYAPVTSASLARTHMGVSAWFLGHIHTPTIQSSGRPVGYLGSLVGLDAGELGAHGPWLAQSSPGQWQLDQIPMSPIRWEHIGVDVEDCVDIESLSSAMGQGLKQLETRLCKTMEGTRVVGVRLSLEGVCRVPLVQVRHAMEQALELDLNLDGVYYFIDKVRDLTRLPLDLDAVAQQNDPAGLMAIRLMDLEAGGEACAKLIASARPRMQAVDGHGNFSHLSSACSEDEEIRDILMRIARRALEELLSQKSAVPMISREEEQHA